MSFDKNAIGGRRCKNGKFRIWKLNRHACRKEKCAADRPSQLTGLIQVGSRSVALCRVFDLTLNGICLTRFQKSGLSMDTFHDHQYKTLINGACFGITHRCGMKMSYKVNYLFLYFL